MIEGRDVLVTGGAGFVGSHLADALVADNDVTVLDALTTGRRGNVPEGVTLVEGDLRDEETVAEHAAGADVIFHQAALVSVAASTDRPRESNAVNVAGTLALFEAARRSDARVVVASSCALYGHPEYVPVDEDHPTEPTSPYGVDKLAVDHYARVYADLYGLPVVPLRYFNVYGPRQSADYSAVIRTFAEQARNGDPITVEGDGTQTRDFVHVSDVVRANLLAAGTDAVGEPFNVGTGTETSIRELAEAVREAADSDSPIVHVDPRPGDIERSVADTARACERLGFEAETSLDGGLSGLFDGG